MNTRSQSKAFRKARSTVNLFREGLKDGLIALTGISDPKIPVHRANGPKAKVGRSRVCHSVRYWNTFTIMVFISTGLYAESACIYDTAAVCDEAYGTKRTRKVEKRMFCDPTIVGGAR